MTQRCEHPGHQSGIDTMLDQCRWENLNPLTLGQHRGLFVLALSVSVERSLLQWYMPGKSKIAGANPNLVWAYIYVHKGGLESHI